MIKELGHPIVSPPVWASLCPYRDAVSRDTRDTLEEPCPEWLAPWSISECKDGYSLLERALSQEYPAELPPKAGY